MSISNSKPKFIASRVDPARAASVGSVEYGQLITALQETVMPPLAAASIILQGHGSHAFYFRRQASGRWRAPAVTGFGKNPEFNEAGLIAEGYKLHRVARALALQPLLDKESADDDTFTGY